MILPLCKVLCEQGPPKLRRQAAEPRRQAAAAEANPNAAGEKFLIYPLLFSVWALDIPVSCIHFALLVVFGR